MARLMGAARLGALAALAVVGSAASPASAQSHSAWETPIAEASVRFGIPAAWIERVIHAESAGQTMRGGRPIRSSAGAMGLMQLMPATWAAMRQTHGLGSDPDDPRDNILAGTAYLRALYDRFGYPGLFAAYNAGPTRYSDYLVRGRRLPGETVAYVATITGRSGAASVRPRVFGIPSESPGLIVIGGDGDVARADSPHAKDDVRPGVFFALTSAPRP